MVFQTAPPQPYSKARCTCAPELAGGADASQNGFGDLMPAKSMPRSAIRYLLLPKPVDRGSRDLSVLGGHHRGCRTSGPDTIAAGEDTRKAGLEFGVHLDEAALGFEAESRGNNGFLLADGFDDLVARDD